MKKLLLLLLISNSSFGEVANSKYEARFNDLIEQSITKECGKMKDLTLIKSVEVEDNIDQGVTDMYYTMTLSGLQHYEQNMDDEYAISLKAEYIDMYDHSTAEYGSYVIHSINCEIL